MSDSIPRPPAGMPSANRVKRASTKEPALAQIASFVDLFVWLLVFKSFFLPLFIIPTGSMAATLAGAHADHACVNCGFEFAVGFDEQNGPAIVQCPNCRWQSPTPLIRGAKDSVALRPKSGDRVVVHGWPYVMSGWMGLGPRRWDVVVFKNPNDSNMNFIKRLIGLPGDTIEIIDGDIWVVPAGSPPAAPPALAGKTATAQDALWIPYYDHDYLPARKSINHALDSARRGLNPGLNPWAEYFPRWSAREADSPWRDLATRRPRFDGLGRSGAIQFTTGPDGTTEPGQVFDGLGYNGTTQFELERGVVRANHVVTDVRLSAEVEFRQGGGSIEFMLTKYFDAFFATLHADGRLTLEHAKRGGDAEVRETWSEAAVEVGRRPVAFSIGHADGAVIVSVDGRPVLRSDPARYSTTVEDARKRQPLRSSPIVRASARDVSLTLSHLRIDRDVHYTTDGNPNRAEKPNAAEGNPLKLRDDAYFVIGDNATNSHDGRFWLPPGDTPEEQERQGRLGPHLWSRYEDGTYDIGTVPADQMIGRAFLVYWPGCLPNPSWVPPGVPNLVPDLGRVRWIH